MAGAQKQESKKSSPAIVGRYAVPVLPGWKMTLKKRPAHTFKRMKNGVEKIYNVPAREEVVYEKTVDNASLSVSLVAIDAGCRVTRADILSGLQMADTLMNMVTPQKQEKAASGKTKPVNFHKLPAYTRQDTLKDRNGLLVESRDLDFGDGTKMYFGDMIIRGAIITPHARTEADRGWRSLINGLHPFPQAPRFGL